jgi:putative membrane protein
METASDERTDPRIRPVPLLLLITGLAYLAWTGWNPAGRFNWLAETSPAMIGGIALIATYRRFPLTNLNYSLIWFFSLILMTGGKYTYAEVPIGNWARDVFGLSRNHFDRFGHFFQGVIPAMMARELLMRTSPLRSGKWLFALCVCVALAVSAGYELFEWRYAVQFGGQAADDFLGMQGDTWDAQKDMFMALSGAVVSLLLLSRLHDRQLRALRFNSAPDELP